MTEPESKEKLESQGVAARPLARGTDFATAASQWLRRNAAVAAVELAAFAFYAALLIRNGMRIHEPRLFGDSDEYLNLAAQPVFSSGFWTGSKPPITALLYRLVGADPGRIFTLQLYLSIICWGLLALAVAAAVRSRALQPAAFGLVLAFSLSRDIFMWDPFIGSESVTMSMTALFVAAGLWLAVEWKEYKAAALGAAGLLMALSRDASAYLLPLTAVALIPLLWSRRQRAGMVAVIAAFLLTFAGSQALSRAAHREDLNFASITAFRIFPNEQYVDFFRKMGMPADPALVEESHYSLTAGHEKYAVIGALLADPTQQPYRDWVRAHSSQAYLKFLWFFKADTLQGMFTNDAPHVFYPDLYYYTATGYRPIIRDARLAELLYPSRLGLLLFFAANFAAALALAYAVARRKIVWLVPVLLILFTYPQAFIAWNGDANEIPRHSVEHNVTERLGVWILVILVLDLAIQRGLPMVRQAWGRMQGRRLRAATQRT